MIRCFNGINPTIHETCFIAENASVIGNVQIGSNSSVWFGSVIRGDEDSIYVGENTNIQDNAVLHCEVGYPIKIGNFVTVGHGAIVHGAILGDNVLVGMGAIIMNGVEIGANSVIGAGALCTENMVIPKGSVAVGIPAKVIKNADAHNKSLAMINAAAYVDLGEEYAKNQ